MAITQNMLKLELTDVYDFDDIIRAVQFRRFVDFVQDGRSLLVKTLHAFLDDESPADMLLDSIIAKSSVGKDSEFSIVKHKVSMHDAAYDVFKGEYQFTMYVGSIGKNEPRFARKLARFGVPKENKSSLCEVQFTFYGASELVTELHDLLHAELNKHIDEKKRSVIQWRYTSGHSTESMLLSIEKNWDIYPEAYPWITKPLNEYYQDYSDSSASILICYGPPGTGKTSFIRDYLCEQKINALVSYDAAILASDEMFTFFLSSPAYDALVIEDADDMLTADREGNNKMIAKLLNASDGLLKLPRKKVILSTNLENLSHIDEAVVRPGRCFDILNFRQLTRSEQIKLCEKLKIEPNVDGDASLAEIYQTSEESYRPKHKTMGFV